MSNPAICPPLSSLPKANSSLTSPDIIFSSDDRILGSEIVVTCPDSYYVVGSEFITCLDGGKWSVDKLPHCSDVIHGMPDSTKLYIGVFAACGALVLLSFTLLIVKIACFNGRNNINESSRHDLGKSTESVASIKFISPNDQCQFGVSETDCDVAGHHFETFVNPTYYDNENVITEDRWRERMSNYDSSYGDCESGYCPSNDWPNEQHRKWSVNSIRAVDGYDFDRYSRIPRAKSPIVEILPDDSTEF